MTGLSQTYRFTFLAALATLLLAGCADKVTAQDYEKKLVENLQALVERLKTKRYRAKLVRRCYIPKENGKERPLGIPALEDRLVQLACAKLLTSIFEADFFNESSHTYSPTGDGAFNRLPQSVRCSICSFVSCGRYSLPSRICQPPPSALYRPI